MDFQLTDEQRALQDVAARFAASEIAPHAAHWDARYIFPRDTLRAAAALGFAALYCREEVGGAGLGRLDAALLFEELSAACVSTAAFLSIHNMASWMVDRFAAAECRARFMPALVAMEKIASYCLTEPQSGSDAAALRTQAVRDGDSYVLTGSKAFISGAPESDLYLVMCRTGAAGPKGISCLVVEKGMPGLSFGAQEKKVGWHNQPTAMVMLDAVRVPVANRLGDEGEGFRIAMQGLDGGRVNIAACALGGARACLDAARRYMQEREQFGRKLADFQALQFRLADMATALEAGRLLVWRAAAALDAGEPDITLRAAMAKRFATDAAFEICDNAMQLLGGYGYLHDYPVERFWRDVRVHRILEGTNEIMRVIIARQLLRDAV